MNKILFIVLLATALTSCLSAYKPVTYVDGTLVTKERVSLRTWRYVYVHNGYSYEFFGGDRKGVEAGMCRAFPPERAKRFWKN